MNRKGVYIFGSVLFILLGVILVFVFKVQGSNESSSISGCTPFNVELSRGENDFQLFIDWNTQDECLGYVMYGDDRESLDLIAIDTQKLSSKSHRVAINKLLTSKTYYFVIQSDDITYGDKGIPLSFSLSSL